MTGLPLHNIQSLRRAAARLHDTEMPPQAAELVVGWIVPLIDALGRARTDRIVSAVFAGREQDCPQPFALYRHSRTVAYGAQFTDGTVVIQSGGDTPRIVVCRSLDSAMELHDCTATDVVWLSVNLPDAAASEAALERLAVAAEAVLDEADAFARAAGQAPSERDRCAAVIDELRRAVNAIPVSTRPSPPTKRHGEKR